jgi:hypothetical protein
MFPGRLLEVPGDRHPREMIMARLRVQNSAYSPLQFLFSPLKSYDDTPDGFLFLFFVLSRKLKLANHSYSIKMYSGHIRSDFV